MINDKNKVFDKDFGDSFGGTEIQVQGLLDNVDNELLKKFQWVVSYPESNFKKDPNKITLFWLHDLADDPAFIFFSDEEFREQFDYFIFVSNWQKEMFRIKYNLPYSKCIVIKNAITPITEVPSNKFENVKKCKIIHMSSPHKALPMVFAVYKEIYNQYKGKVELNVFSNFDFYGEKNKIRNKPFEKLYEEIKAHEGINYFGSVKHEKVLGNLKDNHIFVLPSMFPETSCISMMEAMSAKTLCVHNNLGALSETSADFGVMYRYSEDIQEQMILFYSNLIKTIDAVFSHGSILNEHLDFQKVYFDNFYGWRKRKEEWNNFLTSLTND